MSFSYLKTRLDDLSRGLFNSPVPEQEIGTQDILILRLELQARAGIIQRQQASLNHSDELIIDLRKEVKEQAASLSALSEQRKDLAIQNATLRATLEDCRKKSSDRDNELQLEIHGLKQKVGVLEEGCKSHAVYYDVLASALSDYEETEPSESDNLESDATKIIAIIDGDGHIFNATLIKRGKQGGIEAAKLLTNSLTSSYLRSRKNAYPYLEDEWSSGNADEIEDDIQLWVYIFMNRRGLKNALFSREICTSSQYESFMAGFTQFSPRFMVCDAHSGKDAADFKVREFLLNYTRLLPYKRIFFGGGHDSGYSATLQFLEHEGLLKKIVLLRGYKDIASKISSFELPELAIDGLFMKRPLSDQISKTMSTVLDSDDGEGDQFGLPPTGSCSCFRSHPSSPSTSGGVNAKAFVAPIQIPVPRSSDPHNDDSEIKLRLREMSEDVSPICRKGKSGTRRGGKHNGYNIIWQNVMPENTKISLEDRPSGAPSPCYYFYLAECKAGIDCPLGHFYILQPKDMNHLKAEAPNTPCLAVQKNLPCALASRCPMAHRCPHGPECKQYRDGKDGGRRGCRFKGGSMHSF